MPRMQPSAGSGVRRIGEARPQAAGRTINLTGSAHASAPLLDDGQRGPKVLGKIELPKPAPRPSAPVTPARRATAFRPALAFCACGAAGPAARSRRDAAARRRPAKPGARADQEKARGQEGRARLHRRTRDARPARAQEAARPARQGAAQDRDHHAQGLQARGPDYRGCHRRRSGAQHGRQGRRDHQEADGRSA